MTDANIDNSETLCLPRRQWITVRVRQQDEEGRYSEWSEPRTFFTGEYEHELTGKLYPEWDYHPAPEMAHYHISKGQYDRLEQILTGGPSAPYIHTPEDESEIMTDTVRYEWEYRHYLNLPQSKFRFQVATDEEFSNLKFDQTIGSDSDWIEIDFTEFGNWNFNQILPYPVRA
jgi:hypothetical protein